MAWTFALSLQDQIEKVGAYVGLASFFGLAALTVLYFAQAKELKRLRDWAGRAPERAREIEERAVLQADQARRIQAQPISTPAPVSAAAVAEAAESEEAAVAAAEPEAEGAGVAEGAQDGAVAAGADAVAEGAQDGAVAEGAEAEPEAEEAEEAAEELPVVAGIAAAAVAAAAARAGEASRTAVAPLPGGGPPEDGEYTASNGSPPAHDVPPPAPAIPPAATAAARAAEPSAPPPEPTPARTTVPLSAPQPAATVPPRRTVPLNRAMRPPQPPSRGGANAGRRPAAIAALVGVLIVGGVFLITQLGGDETSPPPNKPASSGATGDTTSTAAAGDQTRTTEATARGDVTVAVYNGTTVAGLAKSISDKLEKAGFAKDAPTGNNTDQTRPTTEVFYASGFYGAARQAASVLEVKSRVQRIDADTQALAGPDAEVVVIAGADQSP